MRRSLLLTTSITALLLGGSVASAEETIGSNHYISLFGGVSSGLNSPFMLEDYLYDTSSKTGFSIGGAFGQYLTPSVRGEVELSYQRYATDSYTDTGNSGASPADGYVQSANLLLNVWKDIDLGTSFTPYVGAGLGRASAPCRLTGMEAKYPRGAISVLPLNWVQACACLFPTG